MRSWTKVLAVLVGVSFVLPLGCGGGSGDGSADESVMSRESRDQTQGGEELAGLKWKFKTEKGVESSPAVSSGVVYFGSEDGHLYAVDIATARSQ